jgi:DNA-directed RNA polymerase specialized sigma24 family protein
MFGIKDLENKPGKSEFEDCCRSVERFICSKIFFSDAEDLIQETISRVLQKLNLDESFKANVGYFIETAKFVLLEYYNRKRLDKERYERPVGDEDEGADRALDEKRQVKDFADQQKRVVINDCMVECFEKCDADDQNLLIRYCHDDAFDLGIEKIDGSDNILAHLRYSIREFGKMVRLIDNGPLPDKSASRLKACRLRKSLRKCFLGCLNRKKSFA